MKNILIGASLLVMFSCAAQKRINPVIKTAGAIFEVKDAAIKPDPNLKYNIIAELVSASEDPKEVNQALNNIARMINLHVMGGVPKENLNVVIAVHGDATYTLTDSETYEKRYNAPNPNIELYKELAENGVTLVVCGQSILARNVDRATLLPNIKIATSMLTTVTTYQLKGYAFMKF